MQNKRTILALAVVATLSFACSKGTPDKDQATSASATAAAAGATEKVIIAQAGPLTGGIAHIGKDTENGVKMAIAELNAKGVTIADKKIEFVMMSEDDAGDPKQGAAVAQKFVDKKVNGVIGHLQSGTTIPASKIYNDAGIPQISPASTNPKYTQQGFNTAFRVVANDGQLGGTLGKYAVNTLHAKNIAVIDDRTAYGQGLAEEFTKGAKAAGANIVSTQFTNDKATDFNAILTQIKAKNPDVIFFGGLDAGAGPMLRQMKSLKINAKLMGGDAICTTELPKLATDGLIDDQVICAVAGGTVPEGKAALEEFKAAFAKQFGAPPVIYAPYSYDATMTMADAMVQANSTDPKVYLPFLAKINHKGVTGNVAFDAKGDMKDATLTLYTYKGGKQTEIGVTK